MYTVQLSRVSSRHLCRNINIITSRGARRPSRFPLPAGSEVPAKSNLSWDLSPGAFGSSGPPPAVCATPAVTAEVAPVSMRAGE